jgi:hypothetical protein
VPPASGIVRATMPVTATIARVKTDSFCGMAPS